MLFIKLGVVNNSWKHVWSYTFNRVVCIFCNVNLKLSHFVFKKRILNMAEEHDCWLETDALKVDPKRLVCKNIKHRN